MEGYTRFSDVTVGSKFPEQPLKFVVSPDQVAAFLDATDGGPIDGDHAPSMLASVYLIDILKARNSPPGGIHAKQSLKFHRRLRIGETLLLQGEVKETFVRRDRPYVVSDFEARDETGALVASGRVTSIWGSAE